MLIKKKYYVIYKHKDDNKGKPFSIVTSKAVADDWCRLNPDYYYVTRTCK